MAAHLSHLKHFDFELRIEQDVDAKFGVIGHIIEIDIKGGLYKVRVNTPDGMDSTDDIWMRQVDIEEVSMREFQWVS